MTTKQSGIYDKMTENQKDIYRDIVDMLIDRNGLEEEKVNPGSKLIDDLEFDSLDTVELSVKLEEIYRIRFVDSELEKVKTVHDLVVLIDKMKN
jgi:acyl carrier protein